MNVLRRIGRDGSPGAWRQLLELVGFATACVGIALVSIPAGLIATGCVLVLVANSRP